MCVLLFDVFKHLLLRKTDILKTLRKFLGKKIWRNALALKSKKVQGIFSKRFILTLLSSAVFRLQNDIFLSLENPCTFLLAKEKTWKRIFNSTNELSQDRTEKQIMPFKITVNWLFDDIWCYLVMGCFNLKNGVFQQTVVRVYCILKEKTLINFLKKCHKVLNTHAIKKKRYIRGCNNSFMTKTLGKNVKESYCPK